MPVSPGIASAETNYLPSRCLHFFNRNISLPRSTKSGGLVVDHVDLGCGGYTGLASQDDPGTGLPVLYASTITGGLFTLRLEATRAMAGGSGGAEAEGWRLRCVGFVPGTAIV